MIHKVYQIDAVDRLKDYPDDIDLVLFDPPFKPKSQNYKQIRKENKNQLVEIPFWTNAEFNEKWEMLCIAMKKKLKRSGWFAFKSCPYTALEVYPIMLKHFDYMFEVIWDKGSIGCGYYVRKQHEKIMVFRPKDAKDTFWSQKPKKNGLKSSWHGNGKGVAFPSVLKVASVGKGKKGSEKQVHINQTPVELWDKFVTYMCPRNGLIVDPFAGTGSVGKSAKRNGRNYYGREVVKEYVDLANQNLKRTQSNDISQYFIENPEV